LEDTKEVRTLSVGIYLLIGRHYPADKKKLCEKEGCTFASILFQRGDTLLITLSLEIKTEIAVISLFTSN
jgi:hypothetical protein